MAITHYHDQFSVCCDFCSDSHDLDAMTFHQAVQCIKDAGWKTTRDGDEYVHACPSCAEDRGQ